MTKLSRLRERLLRSALALFALAFTATAALAQVPSTSPPYNVDIGAVITNTARAPATVNSAQLNNLDKAGAICTLNATALSGTPSVTFSIQNFDTASQQYYTVVTSGAQSPSVNTPLAIMVHYASQTASLPTAVVAAQGVPLARYWRVVQVSTGSNTTMTGTIGCVNVK